MRPVDSVIVFFLGLPLGSLSTLSVARADDGQPLQPAATEAAGDEAAQAFWKGKDDYETGQYAEALEQFNKAYALTGDPDVLYDIAQTYRALGHCESARKSYQDYLRAEPKSSLAPMAQRQLERLQDECHRPPEPAPPQAIQPSAHNVSAATALNNVQSAARESWVAGARYPASTPEPRHFDASEGKSNKTTQVLTLATLSGGVLAGGIATGLAIWNANRYDRWSSMDRSLARGLGAGETPEDWLNRQRNSNDLGRSIQRVDKETLALSIGAAALVATSAVLYLWNPGATRRQRDVITHALELTPQPGMCGLRSACVSLGATF